MVTSRATARAGRLPWVLGICVLAWSVECRCENGRLQPNPKPSIDISPIAAAVTRRAITLDDMVSLREVHEPRQSPDGRRVAFLVKQAFRRCDCYRIALYVVASDGHSPAQKLAEETYIANLQWSPDGRYVSYLSSNGGAVQLWRLSLITHRSNRVFEHMPNTDRSTEHAAYQSRYLPASGVLDYRWSPDGRRIAFTAEPPADPSIAAKAAKEGFRYDDGTMNSLDLVIGDWASAHRSKQLWFYDILKKREHLIWTTPTNWYSNFTALSWSPNGRNLTFFYSNRSGDGSDSMAIVDALTSSISQVGSIGGTLNSSAGVAWSPDGHAIAYLARALGSGSYKLETSNAVDHSKTEQRYEIYPGHSPWLAWDSDRHRILVLSEGIGRDRRQTGMYAFDDDGGEPIRLTAATEKVDDCDVTLHGKVACVRQAPSAPPRIALVSISDDGIQDLADVNPEMASVELAPVRELHWKNTYGDETNGFLILPTHHTAGMRVPLIVIGYAFSGEFVTQAGTLLTSYPAQAFARDGIAVLLFNYPRFEAWQGANFERGSRAFGYGPVASIQAAIEQLDAEGLIDTRRVGMLGHSLAGFWAQLAITQTKLFKVVEMHNGGTATEPGMYWEYGTKQQRELQEHIMGGPPYGETLKNYSGFSMTLNASRIHTPVLMEYDAVGALAAMEYYEAMQHYGIPVEFFIYPNDGHVTEHPEHRFMSLQRNLDWFEFWLLDNENDAASKTDQYLRWRQLRAISRENIQVDLPDARVN
jgi:dipeptidyl aminopeptidase/acylaminoacyl peptidase